MVRLFNLKMEQVAIHPKLRPGEFTRVLGCGGTPKSMKSSLRDWQKQVAEIGPETAEWTAGLIARREEAAMRVLMGIVHQVIPKHSRAQVERACSQARIHGQYRLQEVKEWLNNPIEQQSFTFITEHELIRPPEDYAQFVRFEQQN